MKSLELNNNSLIIELKSWEAIFWPKRIFVIPLSNIKDLTIQNNMPEIVAIKRYWNLYFPGLICIGECYPFMSASFKKLREVSELSCFNYRNKSFLTLFLENESHKKIVLGMSKEEGKEWYSRIYNIINQKNGNDTNN